MDDPGTEEIKIRIAGGAGQSWGEVDHGNPAEVREWEQAGMIGLVDDNIGERVNNYLRRLVDHYRTHGIAPGYAPVRMTLMPVYKTGQEEGSLNFHGVMVGLLPTSKGKNMTPGDLREVANEVGLVL